MLLKKFLHGFYKVLPLTEAKETPQREGPLVFFLSPDYQNDNLIKKVMALLHLVFL